MTILNSQSQIADAPTADLIATYNAFSGKPAITRFSSRAAGEVQTANAILRGTDTAAHAGVPKGAKVVAPMSEAQAAKKHKTDSVRNGVTHVTEQITKTKPKLIVTEGHCPLCNGPASAQTAAGTKGTVAGDERALCTECGEEYWRAGPKAGQKFSRRTPGRDAATSIKTSWTDDEVRAARSLKSRVEVEGETFRSTLAAFKHFKLPITKHIKFRMELKAMGKHVFLKDDGTKVRFALAKSETQ